MKRIFIIIIGFIFIYGCARVQIAPERDKRIQKVYKIAMPKDQIYDSAVEWLSKKFVTKWETISVSNKEQGKIIGRGLGSYSEYFNFFVDRRFSYTVTIDIKDNKYRLTYENFIIYYDERDASYYPAKSRHEVDLIQAKLNNLSDDLYKYITSKIAPEKESIEKKEEEW